MTADPLTTVHLVGADTPWERRATLAALVSRSAEPSLRVEVRAGPAALTDLETDARIALRPCCTWLAARRLRDWLRRNSPAATADRTAALRLHVWSPAALPLAMQFAAGAESPPAILVEADAFDSIEPLARWHASRAADLRFVAATAHRRRRLIERDIAPDSITLIRPCVDFARFAQCDRAALRARLRLAPQDRAVLLAPPLTRAANPLLGAWAAMLVEKIHPGIRVVLPADTLPVVRPVAGRREAARLRAIASSTGHLGMFRDAPPEFAPPELLAACDVVALTPDTSDALTTLIPWIMAAGRPLLATAVPAVTEFAAHGVNARLCLPRSPRDCGRRLLELMEDQESAASCAARARQDSYAHFSLQTACEAYAALDRATPSHHP